MMKIKTLGKRIAAVILCLILLLAGVFAAGRFGWKLGGFAVCETAGIEQVDVGEGYVRIRGFDPGSFPRGFLGYHAEQEGSTLYVGFRFSSLFGIFETGDFDITIPTDGKVTQVVVKSADNEYTVWPDEEIIQQIPEETEPAESVPAPTEEAAPANPYGDILAQYTTALEAGWKGQQLMDAGLNFMVSFVAPETVGWAVEDLDGNGTPELAIGTMAGDEYYGKMIFDLYTLDENCQPLQVFSSIERDRYYYAGENRFANIGASSADSGFVTTLKLEGDELVDMTYTSTLGEYVQMEMTAFVQAAQQLDAAAYIGEYLDYDNRDPNLQIAQGEDGKFIVQIGIFRLTSLGDGVGELTPEGMVFTATDAAGNPISGIITLAEGVATVTFTDSTWELLENGSSFQYEKSSDVPNLWPEF